MDERRCRYCEKTFQPSKYQLRQTVCSDPACQRRRRSEDHRRRLATDPDYRQVCRDSPRKWRARHPGYWKRRRQIHPEVAERNRQRQKLRDQKRRLRCIANNNSVFNLKSVPAEVWLVGSAVEHLANNNSALAQVLVFQRAGGWRLLPAPSCQQQPAGQAAALAP